MEEKRYIRSAEALTRCAENYERPKLHICYSLIAIQGNDTIFIDGVLRSSIRMLYSTYRH